MSITVSSQSQTLLNTYNFTNSDTNKQYAGDASTVSKDSYNVSNLQNALDALVDMDSVNIDSINNVNSYVQNAYKLSQMDSYDSLSSSSSSISRLLFGEASADDINALIGAENEIAADTVISSLSGSGSSTIATYSSYLSQSGSVLNLLV